MLLTPTNMIKIIWVRFSDGKKPTVGSDQDQCFQWYLDFDQDN